MTSSSPKRLGLALSGGGSRGIAHVGVLQVLAEAGIEIHAVAGVSAGAVVAAALAAGLSIERITEMTQRFNWRQIARPAWPRRGFISFAPLERFLVRELGDLDIAQLKLPFAAQATDVVTGESVVFRSGRLAPRVRASCTVPPVVQPVEIDGRLYVDGGLVNNLPISATRSLGVDLVLAINLFPRPTYLPKGFSAYSITVLGHVLLKAGDDPRSADVLVEPELTGFSIMTIKRQELLARGRAAMEARLPELQALLQAPDIASHGGVTILPGTRSSALR